MPLKREASSFAKADPDAKRVKREGGGGNINLASIPMAPVSAVSKFDVKDRKPLDVGAVSVPLLFLSQLHPIASHCSPRLARVIGLSTVVGGRTSRCASANPTLPTCQIAVHLLHLEQCTSPVSATRCGS